MPSSKAESSKVNRLLNICVCVALAVPSWGAAMGLLPKSEGQAAWEALQGQVLNALGGNCAAVSQPAARVSAASAPGTARAGLVANKVTATSLHPIETVKFVIGPQKKQGKPQDAGGLLALTVPASGTYVVGSASRAWIDLVDLEQNSFAKSKYYEWVDFCGRRMKAGVFYLRMGARYWIQMSASPDPTLDLFVAGPLN